MAKSDYTHPSLTLHGRHVPDPDAERTPDAYDSDDPVTGVYEIGVEIDGVFVPILREKAGAILTRVARGKAAAESEQKSSG